MYSCTNSRQSRLSKGHTIGLSRWDYKVGLQRLTYQNEHNFPTITNVRLADIILLPARPGQSGFTMQHDALLRMLHNRKSYPGHFKPKAYKMDWIEACLRENAWLRDEMWDVKLPDLSDTEDEEDEGEENKENRQQGKGGKKNKGESKVMVGAKKP